MAEIVKVKNIPYKLYETRQGTWRGYVWWGGKAWSTHKATKEAVLAEVKNHAVTIHDGIVTTHLSQKEAQDRDEAIRKLEPFSVTLSEAADYYIAHHKGLEKDINVFDAVKEFLDQKTKDGFSTSYLHQLKVTLKAFKEKFEDVKLNVLTASSIDAWLRSLKSSARSRNNYRIVLITFFRWARDRGYLPYGQPVAPERTQPAKNIATPITVISPRRLARLIVVARAKAVEYPNALTCILFGAHTGIRFAELTRLNWEDVNIEAENIEIGADIAKTASRRLVPINSAFKAWLQSAKKKAKGKGPIVPSWRVYEQMTALWPKSKQWPRNCLRHSYISYRVAETEDVAKVALEAGNSPQKIFSNYRSIKLPDGRLITKELAAKWFAAVPS